MKDRQDECVMRMADTGGNTIAISSTNIASPEARRRSLLLKCANAFGNVDLTRTTLTKHHRHVPGKRLQPLCRTLGIKYAEAVVSWSGKKRYGYKPVTDGVVVSAVSAPKLLNAIEARKLKNPPEKRENANRRRHERRISRLREAGIDNPGSRTAIWYEHGHINAHEAQLIQFKANYRHEFTSYESLLEELRQEAQGHTGQTRRTRMEDVQNGARAMATEQPIPDTWKDYLEMYSFPFWVIADRLAKVLILPQEAHPIWFCEAVLAVHRFGCNLDDLTYEGIRDAIERWRHERLSG